MKKLVLIIAVVCTFSILTSCTQEITQWRGENSSGIYPAKNLLNKWPASGPKVLWSTDILGEGHSSPAFANDKIYVTGMIDNQGILFVFDKQGNKLKEYQYGKEWEVNFPGSRSTVTIAGNMAYLYSGYGNLACLDLDSGDIVWKASLFENFDGENIRWGVTESVVVDGDLVFCAPGGKKDNVVALNRFTGEKIWSCAGLGELSAYCTPLLIKLPARDLLVTMMASHILGIDAKTGEMLWNYEQTNRWSVHANTPVYHDGSLFCFSGYGQGGVMLKLSEDGTSVTKKWFSKDYDSRMGGVVRIDGYLYGSGDATPEWMCIDWNTGETIYKSDIVDKGVIIAAGDKLFGYSGKGVLFMAEVNPNEFKLISQTKVELGTAQHWAHPVINDGVLYLRHGNALVAYKISK